MPHPETPAQILHLLTNKLGCTARQWSWPLPLPVQFFGIFPTGGTIMEDDQELPWSDELEHKIFVSAIGELPLSLLLCPPPFCLHALSSPSALSPLQHRYARSAYVCNFAANAHALPFMYPEHLCWPLQVHREVCSKTICTKNGTVVCLMTNMCTNVTKCFEMLTRSTSRCLAAFSWRPEGGGGGKGLGGHMLSTGPLSSAAQLCFPLHCYIA